MPATPTVVQAFLDRPRRRPDAARLHQLAAVARAHRDDRGTGSAHRELVTR